MKTEDLFRFGVTPKKGESAGKRFKVENIDKEGVHCEGNVFFAFGAFDVWQPEKTVFESGERVTWGALKKAMSASGLSDDTVFYVAPFDFFGTTRTASAKVMRLDGKPAVLMF